MELEHFILIIFYIIKRNEPYFNMKELGKLNITAWMGVPVQEAIGYVKESFVARS